MKVTRTGTYKICQLNADGEYVCVRTVDYTYTENVARDDAAECIGPTAERNAWDLKRREAEAEAFERFVDLACEWEG